MGISKTLAIYLIIGYRKFISPLFPPVCRFYPSCSQYAEEAIFKYGLLRGLRLSAARVLRCHPWSRGGVDCVPSRLKEQ